MLSTVFSIDCAPNFIQNTDRLIAYNNIESRFPNHVFFIFTLVSTSKQFKVFIILVFFILPEGVLEH